MDNAHILPGGDKAEIKRHVLHVLEAGQEGGLVIGAHSIGPDVSVKTYDYLHRLILKHGRYVCSPFTRPEALGDDLLAT